METNENKNTQQTTQPQQGQQTQPENTAPAINQQNDGNKKKDEEVPKSRFNVQPIQFPAATSGTFMNGMQLRSVIDDMFRAVLSDYAGCELKINDCSNNSINKYIKPAQPYVNLRFRESTAPGLKVLKRRFGNNQGLDMIARMAAVFGAQADRAYIIDTDVLEALEEFLPVDPKAKNKIDWDRRTVEYQLTNGPIGFFPSGFNSGGYIEVMIMGFPIEMILRKIYGGSESIAYVVNAFMNTANGRDLVFNISRMDTDGVDAFSKAMGFMDGPMPMPYYGMPTLYGYNMQQQMTQQ